MSDTRQHLHDLIDRLPPGQLDQAAALLESMDDPFLRLLANAPLDTEPISVEANAMLDTAHAEIAQGKVVSRDDILRDFGVAPRSAT